MSPPARPLRARLGAVIVLALGVMALLALYADVRRLGASLGSFAWPIFLGALALASANYGIRFVRWTLYLRWLGIDVPYGPSLRIFLGGFLFSVSPAKVGEVYKSVLLERERGVPVARTASIVVAERLTDLLALVALASVGARAFRRGVPVLVAGLALVVAILAVASFERLGRPVLAFAHRVPGVRRFAPALEEAYGSLRALLRPTRLVVPTLLATAAWWAECLAFWWIVRGFSGATLSLSAATFSYSVATVAGAVAMMPGGLGVTELGLAGLVEALGHSTPTVAVAATLLVRLATLWWAVAVGAVAASRSRRRE